ncbi:MAG TPA: hypothetical protein VE954_09295 [Oligoflexus sp.]|uniref:hypothetical protein n=1 Tax=Oligoflexus sp. TaxID=1971216 RepID=UPI002D628420|nr:hypothetical protein [Oligoflexus sp.]HYX33296.1 hypothetical protein [Oligoflexus sp.]
MKIVLTFCMVLLSGCAHSIHQVYVSAQDSQSAGQGQWVTADASDFVILGFQTNTGYVEAAYRELENKCSGRLAQVTTEHLTSFKLLSYDQKVVLKGLCLKS